MIISKIKTIDLNYRKLFKKPKIGILGLNHNAELRNESEEKKNYYTFNEKLRKLQINAIGPLIAMILYLLMIIKSLILSLACFTIKFLLLLKLSINLMQLI